MGIVVVCLPGDNQPHVTLCVFGDMPWRVLQSSALQPYGPSCSWGDKSVKHTSYEQTLPSRWKLAWVDQPCKWQQDDSQTFHDHTTDLQSWPDFAGCPEEAPHNKSTWGEWVLGLNLKFPASPWYQPGADTKGICCLQNINTMLLHLHYHITLSVSVRVLKQSFLTWEYSMRWATAQEESLVSRLARFAQPHHCQRRHCRHRHHRCHCRHVRRFCHCLPLFGLLLSFSATVACPRLCLCCLPMPHHFCPHHNRCPCSFHCHHCLFFSPWWWCSKDYLESRTRLWQQQKNILLCIGNRHIYLAILLCIFVCWACLSNILSKGH